MHYQDKFQILICLGSGSSGDPCSDTYRGPSGLSEPENAAVAAEVMNIRNGGGDIILYMDVHSYSQYWLVPWGGSTAKPPAYKDMVGIYWLCYRNI